MSTEKKTASATRKKYSASTRGAIVDALSGKRGVPVHMSAHVPDGGPALAGEGRAWFRPPVAVTFLGADHHDDEGAETEDRGHAGHPQRPHDDEAVAPRHRV